MDPSDKKVEQLATASTVTKRKIPFERKKLQKLDI
jgi:hypothetical protein